MKYKTASSPLVSPYESDKRKMDRVLKRMLNTSPQEKKKDQKSKSKK